MPAYIRRDEGVESAARRVGQVLIAQFLNGRLVLGVAHDFLSDEGASPLSLIVLFCVGPLDRGVCKEDTGTADFLEFFLSIRVQKALRH